MEASGPGAPAKSDGQQGSSQGVSPTTPVSQTEQSSSQAASIRSGTQHEQGSDEVSNEPQCAQCEEEDKAVDAIGYCTECNDYLCSDCVQQHHKLRVSKDHTVLTGQDMPNITSLLCPRHPRESLSRYCRSENTFGCDTCFTVGHQTCKHIGLISDLCKHVESSEELNELQMASKRHSENVDLYRKLISEYRVINDNCYDQSIGNFQLFRTDTEAMLNQLGETVIMETGQLRDKNKKKLDSLSETVTSLSLAMEALMSDIELKLKTNQKELLFVSVMKKMKQIKETEHELVQLKAEVQTELYEFEAERALKQIIDKKTNISGVLKVLSGDIQCTGQIDIHSPDDMNECYVDGMVEISPNEIVVIDYGNTCMKKIGLANNDIICKREMKSFALDIAIIPESRLVLTLPELKQLHFFSTEKTLDPCGVVDVDGQCMSVVATDDRLAVSFRHPPKVQIMDFEGLVKKTIISGASGTSLFDYPRCLISDPKNNNIYISDRSRNTVTCLSIEGDFRWMYTDEQLNFPVGVAIDANGLLYVCSRDTHAIHVVSPAGVCLRIIPMAQFQIEYPKTIHYSRRKGALYVSNQSADKEQLKIISQLSLR